MFTSIKKKTIEKFQNDKIYFIISSDDSHYFLRDILIAEIVDFDSYLKKNYIVMDYDSNDYLIGIIRRSYDEMDDIRLMRKSEFNITWFIDEKKANQKIAQLNSIYDKYEKRITQIEEAHVELRDKVHKEYKNCLVEAKFNLKNELAKALK